MIEFMGMGNNNGMTLAITWACGRTGAKKERLREGEFKGEPSVLIAAGRGCEQAGSREHDTNTKA